MSGETILAGLLLIVNAVQVCFLAYLQAKFKDYPTDPLAVGDQTLRNLAPAEADPRTTD